MQALEINPISSFYLEWGNFQQLKTIFLSVLEEYINLWGKIYNSFYKITLNWKTVA